MTRNAIGWALFLICCAAQIAVPASMILRHERTLGSERVYLFRCAPVDPVDAFRGRYVALSFEQSRFEGQIAETLVPGSTAFATLDVDDEGFARIVAIAEAAPQDADYLAVRIRGRSAREAQLELPFDRYYMGESFAPEADRVYADRAADQEAWVAVHVRDGHAVLEELYLDGLPIREFLEQN